MTILKKAGVSAITVEPSTSVLRAVRLMKEGGVDTLFVNEGGAAGCLHPTGSGLSCRP